MKANYAVQHLSAPNDPSGNPRRLYYVVNLSTGSEIVFDEAYAGWQGLPEYIRLSYFELLSLDITATEYKTLLKRMRHWSEKL